MRIQELVANHAATRSLRGGLAGLVALTIRHSARPEDRMIRAQRQRVRCTGAWLTG
ncbi:MAG: hypothetical protein KME55_36750 [Nostoc indistinguendum CM1-VF10]|nr:hypothetical protein [Nostoc indistinguendum CM1-VF10]